MSKPKAYPPPEPAPGELWPACGADPVGPVSGAFLLEWMRKRPTVYGPGGYVNARTSRTLPRYLSDEPSAGPLTYSRVPGKPKLLWVSRVDLVTLFGAGADVELMEEYNARQTVSKRGRIGRAYTKRKPRPK